MKQNCQIHMGIVEYEIAGTQLKTRGNDTTHQHFLNEVHKFVLAQVVKKSLAIKF